MRTYGRLREQIKKKFVNQKSFAVAMGMSVTTLNLKLNGKSVWTVEQIEKACALLGISIDEVKDYFFYE